MLITVMFNISIRPMASVQYDKIPSPRVTERIFLTLMIDLVKIKLDIFNRVNPEPYAAARIINNNIILQIIKISTL